MGRGTEVIVVDVPLHLKRRFIEGEGESYIMNLISFYFNGSSDSRRKLED